MFRTAALVVVALASTPDDVDSLRAEMAKMNNQMKLEKEALEAKLEALNEQTADPDFYSREFAVTEPVLQELAATQEALDRATERWIALEEMQEQV